MSHNLSLDFIKSVTQHSIIANFQFIPALKVHQKSFNTSFGSKVIFLIYFFTDYLNNQDKKAFQSYAAAEKLTILVPLEVQRITT